VIITNPFSPGTWTRDQIDAVSRGWWVLVITGVLSVVAGGIILFVEWSIADLALFVGLLLIFRGVVTATSVPVDGSARNWSIGFGLIEALVGLAVLVWPGPTLLVVALTIGWYVLFSGVMTIVGAITARDVLPYWGVMLVFGLIETLFSFWLLARPELTLVAAVLAIGLWSLFYGVVQIALAFEMKALPHRADRAARDLDSVLGRPSVDATAG
jgi:uncharacterized membrane protein HdeD (DUF308 family)